LVTHAQERAQNHVIHSNWEGATEIFSKPFAICIKFGQTSPLAIEATAVLYEGLRAAVMVKYLWGKWQPDSEEILGPTKQEFDLQQLLERADDQVILNLGIMQKIQRRANAGGGRWQRRH
jgi:hypothetical protein